MTNIIDFKQSQETLHSNVQRTTSELFSLDDEIKDIGLGVIADIDHGIKGLSDLKDVELESAIAVASAFYQSCHAEAEAAGETLTAIADVIQAVLESDDPKAIRELTQRPQRRLAEISFEQLTSRDRRLVVAAWARRKHELCDELERRNELGDAK